MEPGPYGPYTLNQQVTRAYFGQLLKCMDTIVPSHRAEAVDKLADAVRTGRFDTVGCPNGGAASLRLDHFKSLADAVARLNPPQRSEAMDRLLSHAFAETEKDMGYAKRVHRPWKPRIVLVELAQEIVGIRPDGLDVKQEAALFLHLARTAWTADWNAASAPTGQLMRRIHADLLAREKRQLGVDTVTYWIKHGIDCAASTLSGVGGAKSGRNVSESPGRPIIDLTRSTPANP